MRPGTMIGIAAVAAVAIILLGDLPSRAERNPTPDPGWPQRLAAGAQVVSVHQPGAGLEVIELTVPSRLFKGDPAFDVRCLVARDMASGHLSNWYCRDPIDAGAALDTLPE